MQVTPKLPVERITIAPKPAPTAVAAAAAWMAAFAGALAAEASKPRPAMARHERRSVLRAAGYRGREYASACPAEYRAKRAKRLRRALAG
jgi:hypothetical protein